MGVVFKARHLKLNRTVAVKMTLAGPLAGPLELERFRAEAEAAAHLQHPNIVTLHEVGERDGLPYFSMEYVEGQTLAQLVQSGPLAPKRAAGYLKTIAEAIDYAHQQGVLHRDLKPSNILVDKFDEPRITDFGLAKRFVPTLDSPDSPSLTLTGQVLGTPNFMPPEQAVSGLGSCGPQSDVYSLGAILYFLLTGKPPFAGATPAEVLTGVLNCPPTSPRAANPSVPRDLETICLKCLEKDPRRRYSNAHGLAADLARFLSDKPILARSVGPAERAWRWCRRYPAVASLAISLGLTLMALTFVLTFLRASPNPAPRGNLRLLSPSLRPSYNYTGEVQQVVALDGDTFKQTRFGLGQSPAIDPKRNRLWCPLLVSNAVVVRDGSTGAPITNLTLADCPGVAVFDPNHRIVWVTAQCGLNSNTNYPSNDLLWAIDADTYIIVGGPVPCGGVNGGPEFVNPLTGRFYHNVDGAQCVDPRNFIATRPTFGVVRAVDATTGLIYADGPGSSLQILDGSSDPEKVVTNVALPFPITSAYVAINPVQDRAYVGVADSPRVLVLEARTGHLLETIDLDSHTPQISGIHGLASDPVRARLYAIAGSKDGRTSYLYSVEGSSQRVATFSGWVAGPVLNPASNKIYVWGKFERTPVSTHN